LVEGFDVRAGLRGELAGQLPRAPILIFIDKKLLSEQILKEYWSEGAPNY
jgi:hypothetical protein